MNMTNEQVQAAIGAGLALTNPESDTTVPMKHAAGATILHQLLLGIASGQVRLESGDPAAAAEPKGKPGSKKVAKKKATRRKVAKKSKVTNRKK